MLVALWSTGYGRGVGGSEQVVNAVLRRLPADACEILLITNGRAGQPESNPFFPALPGRVERLVDTFPNPLLNRDPVGFVVSLLRYFRAAVRLLRVFRRRTPAIVHLHFVSVDVFLLALFKYLFGYRLLITFCGGDLAVTEWSAMARLKVRTALRCANRVTTVSREMAGRLRDEFDVRSVVCIPNGVDHAEIDEALTRATPEIPPDQFVFVGRLHPDKRVPLLVRIFKASIDAGCDRNLYIVGDGEDRASVAGLIAQHGLGERIIMLGAMSHRDALAVVARSRCLLLTSSAEGCPNVVLEAMALGVPVIATRVGGVPDLLTHGDTGFLFPADEPDAATPYIVRMAANPAEAAAMGRRSAEIARRRFDLTDTAAAYLAVYRSLFRDIEPTPGTQATAWPGIGSR